MIKTTMTRTKKLTWWHTASSPLAVGQTREETKNKWYVYNDCDCHYTLSLDPGLLLAAPLQGVGEHLHDDL
jgi:hypothetical protein